MTRNTRIGLLVAAVVVAVAAIVIIGSSGGDDDSKDSSTAAQTTPATTPGGSTTTTPAKPAAPAIPVVTIRNGKAVGGVKTITVKQGDRARFKVVSDKAYEIHLHGFDIAKDVAAGGSVSYNVKTDAPGIYEFEIEDTGTKIGQVKVEP